MTPRYNDTESRNSPYYSKQLGEYRLSAINDSRESIKNHEYLLKFEAKFEKSLNTG